MNKIKWAWQRAVRGYDDRIFWGFDGYFEQFIPPLEKFCVDYLRNKERAELNEKRAEICRETIRRIRFYQAQWAQNTPVIDKASKELWQYVGAHMAWYWD
jgi:hypothetical protein